jgi:hypothetical protein
MQSEMTPAHDRLTEKIFLLSQMSRLKKVFQWTPGHRQGIICCVAFVRSSLRRIGHTPQSSLLGALHLMPCR